MDNNKNDNTNMMAILGFIFSIVFSIVGLILSIIALKQIKERNEKGKGLAIAGLIISIISIIFSTLIIILAIIAIVLSNNMWELTIDSTKCALATECIYDETSGYYNCTYIGLDREEEYIICDEDSIPNTSEKATFYSTHEDDEDYEDTFDYDREY